MDGPRSGDTGSGLRRVGDRGLLAAALRPAEVAAALHHAALAAGVELSDVVPGAVTVLAVAARVADLGALRGIVTGIVATADAGSGMEPASTSSRTVTEIAVIYDGADLASVALSTGLSVEEVITEHKRGVYVADFTGFAPGFAYLSGLPPALQLPRLRSPRPAVPAGSVAIADRYCAVYPRASPGGWHLLGHTQMSMWDSERRPPALLTPGSVVRFVTARATGTTAAPVAPPGPLSAPASDVGPPVLADRGPVPEDTRSTAGSWLEVLDAGLLTTVQDPGRPGLADQGVSPSGWLDERAASLANRLVGNEPTTAVLESTISGPMLRLGGTTGSGRRFAFTGAPAPVRVDGRPVAMHAPVEVPVGARIEVGTVTAGARTYVAVAGGFDVSPELGSRATDLLSGLGPPPLCAGQRLALGADTGRRSPVDVAPVAALRSLPVLRVRPGPRADRLAPDAIDVLVSTTWTVSPESNRVGLRLHGAVIGKSLEGELAPEAIVTGSVQVPPSGEPVLFLADHPVTGGYPVLAVVVDDDVHLAAQVGPGATLRLAVIPGAGG